MTGIAVFVVRIFNVSIGTIGTIVTVQGRSLIAFFLAAVEGAIWITVVSVVIHQVTKMPILVIFYSLGYATGTVVGSVAERKFAFGMIILKVFGPRYAKEIADAFRRAGQPVTIFTAEGMKGPVLEF